MPALSDAAHNSSLWLKRTFLVQLTTHTGYAYHANDAKENQTKNADEEAGGGLRGGTNK